MPLNPRVLVLAFLVCLAMAVATPGAASAASGKRLPTFAECTFHIPVETGPRRTFRDYYEFFRTLNSVIEEHAVPRLHYAFNYRDFRGLSVLLFQNCGEKEEFRRILIKEMRERHGAGKPIAVGEGRDAVVNYNLPRLYWPQIWSDADPGIVGSPQNPLSMDIIPGECRTSVYFIFNEDVTEEIFDSVGSQIFKFVTDVFHKDLFWGFMHFTGSYAPDYKEARIDFGFLENCDAKDEITSGIFALSRQLKAEGGRTYWSQWEAAGLKEYRGIDRE